MARDTLLPQAAELIQACLRFDAPADSVASQFFARHRALGARDRAVLADTLYCVLRRHATLQHQARGGPGEMARRLAILGWQGSAAALDATLSAPEKAWRAEAQAMDLSGLPEATRLNLPPWLVEALRTEVGDELPALVAALEQAAPLDLRVNTHKARREAVRLALQAQGVDCDPTPWAPDGLRARGKPALQKLDLYLRGEIEVQDEGSQLLALLVQARRQEHVVDFCAGAGGKTLALGAAMRNTGRLYAFDVSGHRLDALRQRLARSGLTQVYPTQIAHERDERIGRLAGKVHRVLVDAPCSGLGTLRRNPDLKWRQSAADIDHHARQQQDILAAAARLPQVGGRLVYATCSLLSQENEQVAEAFGQAHPSFRPVPVADILAQARVSDAATLVRGAYLRLWPHRHATDGFFAAVWERWR